MRMYKTIRQMDEYCRLHNKAIIIHTGRFVGFVPGYLVSERWNAA